MDKRTCDFCHVPLIGNGSRVCVRCHGLVVDSIALQREILRRLAGDGWETGYLHRVLKEN